jgi:hypothetical protein
MNRYCVQPAFCQFIKGDVDGFGGGRTISGSWGAKSLAELPQLLSGNVSIFGLKAQSMLSAQMFDHSEIRTRLGAIQTLADLRQYEAAGWATLLPNALVDRNHQGQGWRGGANHARHQAEDEWIDSACSGLAEE